MEEITTVKASSTSRLCKRQDRRRRLIFNIKCQPNASSRRRLTEAEFYSFVNAIEKSRTSVFGIEKMSRIDLDHMQVFDFQKIVCYDPRYCHPLQSSAPLQRELYVNVLVHAIRRRNHNIIAALLRAGANPFIHEIVCPSNSFLSDESVARVYQSCTDLFTHYCSSPWYDYLMNQIPRTYFVWLILFNDQLRRNLYLYLSTTTKNDIICEICCLLQSNAAIDFYAYNTFLRLDPCGHIICHSCFWKHSMDFDPRLHKMRSLHQSIQPQPTLSSSLYKLSVSQNEIEKQFISVDQCETYFVADQNNLKNCVNRVDTLCPVCTAPIVTEYYRENKEIICRKSKYWSDYRNTSDCSIEINDAINVQREVSCEVGSLLSENRMKNCEESLHLFRSFPKISIALGKKPIAKFANIEIETNARTEVTTNIGLAQEEKRKTLATSFDGHIKDTKLCFQPLPLHVTEVHYLGISQSQRLTELYKVGVTGDVRRLAALIDSGIDLHAINEYGQTIGHLFVWYNHNAALRYYVYAGGAVLTRDNSGATCFSMACHQHAVDMILFLYLDCYCRSKNDIYPYASSDLEEYNRFLAENFLEYVISSHLSSFLNKPAINYSTKVQRQFIQTSNLVLPSVKYRQLIPDTVETSSHPGVNKCFVIDGAYDSLCLQALLHLHQRLPTAPKMKDSCSMRSYYCDINGSISKFMQAIVHSALNSHHLSCAGKAIDLTPPDLFVFPQMRFLHYSKAGDHLEPHIDLTRTDPYSRITSTHTFLLYLTDCPKGGETVLLQSVKWDHISFHDLQMSSEGNTASSNEYDRLCGHILSIVSPSPGRLFLFPHNVPHSGIPLVSCFPNKILIRGEIHIPSHYFPSSSSRETKQIQQRENFNKYFSFNTNVFA